MNLIISATVENISTRADNTIKVVIGTQEMDAEQSAKLFQFRNRMAKVLFSTEDITKEIKEAVITTPIDAPKPKTKTQSQRIRNVLYLLFQQGGEVGDFEQYYNFKTNQIIEHLKTQLKPK